MKKTDKEVENSVSSELKNLIHDFNNQTLTEEILLNYISIILRDANVDSKIVVNILERFGDIGKYEALCIKINEGW